MAVNTIASASTIALDRCAQARATTTPDPFLDVRAKVREPRCNEELATTAKLPGSRESPGGRTGQGGRRSIVSPELAEELLRRDHSTTVALRHRCQQGGLVLRIEGEGLISPSPSAKDSPGTSILPSTTLPVVTRMSQV
jgi:hypothetical protein